MIIDELLDRINDKRLLNIEYIKKQAMQFEFEYILKPILNQDKHELKQALKQYIIENEYNTELLKDIDNINISFVDNETAQAQIIEQIETTLFYIENINQVNTDNILQEFYNDIKKCFECVGVNEC